MDGDGLLQPDELREASPPQKIASCDLESFQIAGKHRDQISVSRHVFSEGLKPEGTGCKTR